MCWYQNENHFIVRNTIHGDRKTYQSTNQRIHVGVQVQQGMTYQITWTLLDIRSNTGSLFIFYNTIFTKTKSADGCYMIIIWSELGIHRPGAIQIYKWNIQSYRPRNSSVWKKSPQKRAPTVTWGNTHISLFLVEPFFHGLAGYKRLSLRLRHKMLNDPRIRMFQKGYITSVRFCEFLLSFCTRSVLPLPILH